MGTKNSSPTHNKTQKTAQTKKPTQNKPKHGKKHHQHPSPQRTKQQKTNNKEKPITNQPFIDLLIKEQWACVKRTGTPQGTILPIGFYIQKIKEHNITGKNAKEVCKAWKRLCGQSVLRTKASSIISVQAAAAKLSIPLNSPTPLH